jgi:excisionase family DNA binding protein
MPMESQVSRALSLNRMVPRLLRATEVATVLGLGRSKVYDMMKRGQLPVVRIGKAVRVPAHALEEWIKTHTSNAA